MECKIEGCERPVRVKKRMLCSNHYQVWARKNRKQGKLDCDVEGCQEFHYALGYCRNHYNNLKKFGSTTKPPKEIKLCECGKEVFSRNMCKNHYMNWHYHHRAGRGFKGEINSTETPSYYTAHSRVRIERGHPKEYDCVECGGTAEEWALKADAEDIVFGSINGRAKVSAYSLNLDEYQPMCKDCHRAYDARHKSRNYKLQKSRWEEQSQA